MSLNLFRYFYSRQGNQMRLYLVQHGEATSKDVNPDRPLTEKGRTDTRKTAAFLKKAGVSVNQIWHSTKTRAIETAHLLADSLSVAKVKQKDGLAPNDPVAKVFSEIASIDSGLMVVGHLPFLQNLASLALTGSESSGIVKFKMGGCVSLEKGEDAKWVLVFAVIPDLLE